MKFIRIHWILPEVFPRTFISCSVISPILHDFFWVPFINSSWRSIRKHSTMHFSSFFFKNFPTVWNNFLPGVSQTFLLHFERVSSLISFIRNFSRSSCRGSSWSSVRNYFWSSSWTFSRSLFFQEYLLKALQKYFLNYFQIFIKRTFLDFI